MVYDGEDLALIDVDYTDEATAVTVHFSGFSSTRCGGVSHYEWAVGEGWEEGRQETVMEFTERGIVVNWSTGSGYAQVYYFTGVQRSLYTIFTCMWRRAWE